MTDTPPKPPPDARVAPATREGQAPQAPGAPLGAVPEAPQLQMSRWGRRAALAYLVVCALALVAMLVETVLGHPGLGGMFAAILAVPWSMLMAGFAPPLPRDWPLAAGLLVRMVPLTLFMLLNAAIIRGMAARSERDLARAATRVSLLLLLAAPLGSGCIHLAVGEQKRVDWSAGEQLVNADASMLEREIRGDGLFRLTTVATTAIPTIGGVEVQNLRLMAVFELK